MDSTTAAAVLPKELHKIIAHFPQQSREHFEALHARFKFDDADLEAFMINRGPLSVDQMPEFEEFLTKEATKHQPVPTPMRATLQSDLKRKQQAPTSRLPMGIGAALGLPQSEAGLTPTKRLRDNPQDKATGGTDGATQASGTATLKSQMPAIGAALQVSKKSCSNEHVVKPSTETPRIPATVDFCEESNSLWKGSHHGMYTFMDEALEYRSALRDQRLLSLENDLLSGMLERHANGDLEMVGTVGQTSQSEVAICGRIACEGLEGKINDKSLLLVGSSTASNAVVQLNIALCKSVAAFPGQIAGVIGRSGMMGTTFHAREFVPGLLLPPPTSLRRREATHVLVAAGPFCLGGGLDYAPLMRVLGHALQVKPQVLILMGPFLDANNSKVSSGDTTVYGSDEPCSYEEVYTELILPLLVHGLEPLRRLSPPIEIFVLPSLDEVLCFHPLPQPPLDMSLTVIGGAFAPLHSLGVHFLPNPAHVEVNGLKMTISSADALKPLVQELILRPAGKKIETALSLLLHQRTLFPVVPRDPPQVCESHSKALDFPRLEAPDLCIFPSRIGTATSYTVDGTVFVNPGPVCLQAAFGTFAEFWSVSNTDTAGAPSTPFTDSVRVDIHKLDHVTSAV